MRWIAEDNNLCLFMEVTDNELEFIKNNRKYYFNEDFVKSCQISKGRNAHICLLYINRKTNIKSWIHKLLRDYKTVSWWNPKNKFIIRRLKCHQQP